MRMHWLVVGLVAALLAEPAGAQELDPEDAVKLPGVAAALPKETITNGDCVDSLPCLAAAAMVPATATGATSVVALAILEPLPALKDAAEETEERTRSIRLLMLRVGTPAPLMDRKFIGFGVSGLDAGGWRKGGKGAIAFQVTQANEGHTGPLMVWAVGDGEPKLAFEGEADAQYFRQLAPGDGWQLVAYVPEADSAVYLPSVMDWEGDRLVPYLGSLEGFHRELAARCEEMLKEYRDANQPTGHAPRIVVDAALTKGRLLEKLGDAEGAFDAYGEATHLVPNSVAVPEDDLEEREELLERAAEARRRAAALFGVKVAPLGK